MDSLAYLATEGWVGHRRVLNRGLIWPDLCFGKLLLLQYVKWLEEGKREKKKQEGL